jgi:DNA-binding FrmR family transcriptional regulator
LKHVDTLDRLKKIQGQIGGIIRMVEEGSYCIDIVNQVSAVRGGLDKVTLMILERHLKSCVSSAIKENHPDKAIDELMQTIQRYIK